MMVVATPADARARGNAHMAASAERLSRHALLDSQRWQNYDEAPATPVVRPVRVIQVTGNVINPQALANPGSGQTTTLGSGASLILDYGKDVGGFPELDVASGAGVIKTSYSETLANMGNDGATTTTLFGAGNGSRSDTFPVLGAGLQKASTVSGGERYEKLTLSGPGSVTLRSAGIEFTPPRDTPSVIRGHFLSSDELLNRIWWAGASTLDLNELAPGTVTTLGHVNELHLILDGAKRDRAVWSGDQVISDLTDFYMSDPVYARDSLALFLTNPASNANSLSPATGDMSQPGPLPGGCSPNPSGGNSCLTWSASYSIVVMSALYNYYVYTGDLGFVRAHWQAVERQMAWDASKVDSNGLVAVSGSEGNDWNLENPQGETTYNNALYVQALNDASKLAIALGKTGEAGTWRNQAIKVEAAVNRILWNPTTGVYDASSTIRGAVVQDANVLAILSGIATGQRALRITKTLARALATPYGPVAATPNATGYNREISPYAGSLSVLADFAAGNEPAALALVRREWGFMVTHDPGGVDWERIEPDGVPAGTSGSLMVADSSAHAWSTGPTPALSQYILGVAPASPGYGKWIVAPLVGDLRWAQGVVPSPHGPISVRWERGARNRFFVLTVRAPAGTSGSVTMPLLGHERAIARNGRIVWSHGRPASHVRARLIRGAVLFTQRPGIATYAWSS
jgi:alpha-L-rhamnosidase